MVSKAVTNSHVPTHDQLLDDTNKISDKAGVVPDESPSRLTVVEHVLSRLQDIGIKDVFGVAGDFAFPLNDAICASQKMRWIGSCNELNAAYAADGYARIHGMGALCTTYGVGELSALCGVAGAYAENLPIFHLVGMPARHVQTARRLVHHTLGNGEFDLFHQMAQPVVCASAIMTPQDCAAETERLIAAAFYHRRPVYMAFPTDSASSYVLGSAVPIAPAMSSPEALSAAVKAISDAVAKAPKICLVPGMLVARAGLKSLVTTLVETTSMPYATMFMDKCTLDESLPTYIGMYDGQLMNDSVRSYVEESDLLIGIGAALTDFNSGSFTADIKRANSVSILLHSVRVGEKTFADVEMRDVITALIAKIPRQTREIVKQRNARLPVSPTREAITADHLYPRWEQMLRDDDILIAETGTSSMGMAFASMPKGAVFHNQSLWGSIGWATPASFGAALAAPQKRTILITGEGSHQLTAQEICQFHRFGLKPLIFVLNNDGYLIERLLCKDPKIYYNDLAQWKYHKLPEALGCEGWLTARVTTQQELDSVIEKAMTADTGVYVEVVTGKYAASELASRLHDSVETLYS